jgi:hypothetical protein
MFYFLGVLKQILWKKRKSKVNNGCFAPWNLKTIICQNHNQPKMLVFIPFDPSEGFRRKVPNKKKIQKVGFDPSRGSFQVPENLLVTTCHTACSQGVWIWVQTQSATDSENPQPGGSLQRDRHCRGDRWETLFASVENSVERKHQA